MKNPFIFQLNRIKGKSNFAIASFTLVLIFTFTSCQKTPRHRAQWWFDSINCTYDITAGEGLSLALIDSGIDISHPDLKYCDINVIDLLSKNQKSDKKHGTAMAGVICAKPNSDTGLIGIVPGIKIYDIKIVDNEKNCSIKLLIEAINIAVEKKVDIINISIGTKSNSEELYAAITEALNNNIIVVAATSNAGSEEVLYPAAYSGVIKAIPINKEGGYMYGLTIPEGKYYVKAPGQNIVTTTLNKDKHYCSIEGTSIATALTSGTIARIIYDNPGVDRNQLIKKLYEQKVLTIKIK